MYFTENDHIKAKDKILKSYNKGNHYIYAIRKDTGYSCVYIKKVLDNEKLIYKKGRKTDLTEKILFELKKDKHKTLQEIAEKYHTTRQNVYRIGKNLIKN